MSGQHLREEGSGLVDISAAGAVRDRPQHHRDRGPVALQALHFLSSGDVHTCGSLRSAGRQESQDAAGLTARRVAEASGGQCRGRVECGEGASAQGLAAEGQGPPTMRAPAEDLPEQQQQEGAEEQPGCRRACGRLPPRVWGASPPWCPEPEVRVLRREASETRRRTTVSDSQMLEASGKIMYLSNQIIISPLLLGAPWGGRSAL